MVNGISYEAQSELNPRFAPRGKLPYIIHKGQKISDSELILDYLEREFNLNLNEGLSSESIALGSAVEIICNEHLYFLMLYYRYLVEDNFKILCDIFFQRLKFPLNRIMPRVLYSTVQKQLNGQGIGRMSLEEVSNISMKAVDSLEGLLSENNFFTGEKLCRADYSAFAHLANILYPPFESPLKDYLKSKTRLVGYIDRIKSYYF